MSEVEFRHISKRFGEFAAVDDVAMTIGHGEFVAFVGPSGCGKSTLLRLIAGLEDISDGELLIDGQRANDIPAAKRGVAMVFQSYALYPHMTVRENMSFGLRISGMGRARVREIVNDAARVLQLDQLLERRPRELSGGQRQRVAIGRAIVRKPNVFLFDEPLSNLDASLRVQMRIEIARLHQVLEATMIYVTHDQVEAMTLADRIVVLNAGRVEQVGAPLELYNDPRNLFVAGFIGSPRMNFVEGRVTRDGPVGISIVTAGGEKLQLAGPWTGLAEDQPVTLGLRPERLRPATGPGRLLLAGDVAVVERLGGESLVHLKQATGNILTMKMDGAAAIGLGQNLALAFEEKDLHLFDAEGRRILPQAR